MNLKKKSEKKFSVKRLLAGVLVAAMLCGYVPTTWGNQASAAVEYGKVSDPDTVTRPVDLFAGTSANAGRIVVGKSVSETGVDFSSEAANAKWEVTDPENFLVTISQSAQSVGISSEIPVPIDAVFVLDTSGSMAYDIDSTQENNVPREDQRATHMVDAANDAIAALLAANPLNRVAVVAFSGASDNMNATTVLSQLYSYTDSGNNLAASEHLQWVSNRGFGSDSGNYIAGRNTNGTRGGYRHGKNGGTNIHAGIAEGAKILANATNTTVNINGKEVTRIPFLIVLSDGAPTYSSSSFDWKNPGTGENSQQGPGGSSYVGNAFLPVLTASYYKDVISTHYFGNNVTASNRAYMYTIGVGVDGLNDEDEALALITLNPKENLNSSNRYYESSDPNSRDTDYFKNYWENYQNGTSFTIEVNNRDTYSFGTNWSGTSNIDSSVTSLAYNDTYYPASSASQLTTAFRNIVVEIQKRAISYPTQVSETMTDDYSGYVTFRDLIGEYMEVKDLKGIIGDGNLYQGLGFVKYMMMTQAQVDEDPEAQEFMDSLIHSMEVRFGLRLPGEEDAIHGSMKEFLTDAWNWANDRDENGNVYTDGTTNPNTQMYYNSDTDFDNSMCWWGYTAEDDTVQHLGFAADDSIEYIEAAKEMAANGETYRKAVGTAVPEGATYVARSWFFYGTAGGTVEKVNDYLDLSITVIRELEAPYSQTVIISAPASLLAMQRVLIYDTDKDGNLTAYFDELIPTRIVYEVGLRDDITAESVEGILSEEYKAANKIEGGYAFYTNEWNRDPAAGEAAAMTVATFASDSNNYYYAFDTNTPIYVKDGDSYVKYDDASAAMPSGTGFYYAHEYYTWDENATVAQGKAGVSCSGPLVEYIEINIPEDSVQVIWDSTQGCWVVKAGTFKAQSLVSAGIEKKTDNVTGSAAHVAYPVRTGGEVDPHYAVYLGNNGKLTFKSEPPKSVTNENGDDIDGLAAMVDQKLTYQVTVTNTYDTVADGSITDTIPVGTVLVADSIKVWDGSSELAASKYTFTQIGDVLNWEFADMPVGASYTVEFTVQVTVDALEIEVVSNQATIKMGDNEYKSNLVKNPVEGKEVTGATSAVVPSDGVQVGDELVYTIHYYNDTDQTTTVTVVDQIPAGTEYVDGSATLSGELVNGALTWVIENVPAGQGGIVSFKVKVTAAALTYNPLKNTATIQIGDNAPEQYTNTVDTDVKVGDLELSKVVEKAADDSGLNPDPEQVFTLILTEASGELKDAEEAFDVVNESGIVVDTITFNANSQATVQIKDGQKLTVKDLPAGVTITVVELPVDGYTATYVPTNGTVTIVAKDTVSVEVTNTYDPDKVDNVQTLFKFKKNLISNGSVLKDKEFHFVAHPADASGNLIHNGAVILHGETIVSSDGGAVEIIFDELSFDKTGTYYYLVTETVGSANTNGITYDTTQFLISITVYDDGTGKLKIDESQTALKARANAAAQWTAPADWTFENSYTPNSTTVQLEAGKQLNNFDLIGDDFTFEVVDASGTVVATDKNDALGNIVFPEIKFDQPGTFVFTIREANGGKANIQYDEKTYQVTVVVTDDGNGQLSAAVTYPGGTAESDIVFENTYTPDSVKVVIEAGKSLTGRAMTAGEFQFVLTGSGQELKATNTAAGKIAFAEIEYTLADAGKSFTYTISEVKGSDTNITYDDAEFTVTVNVTYDRENGKLSADVVYPDGGVTFANLFNPPMIEVMPVGTKMTENLATGDHTFEFVVVDKDGNVVSNGTSGVNGKITFDQKLEFTAAGDYNFWIYEKAPDSTTNGITYDSAVYLMVVNVAADPITGLLSSTVNYYRTSAVGTTDQISETAGAIFTNIYDAEGELVIVADKILTGRELEADDNFRFQLTDEDGNQIGDLVSANTEGIIVFPTIKYDVNDVPEEGASFVYIVSEVKGSVPGVTYDTTKYYVYVTVTRNGAELKATITDVKANNENSVSAQTITFTNVYKPAQTTITLGAEGTVNILKTLNGRPLEESEFSFLLEDASGADLDTKENDGEGKVVFDEITYTEAGVYTYIISEQTGNVGGVTYTGTKYTVVVTVTDDLEGQLHAAVTSVTKDGETVADKVVEFVNEYKPEETTAQIVANKILTGRDLKDGEFTFVLEDEDGHRIYAYNDGETITFRKLTYTKAGTYKYTVSEVAGSLGGVQYDKKSYEVTVTVTDDLAGKLSAEVTYPEGGITFVNEYTTSETSLRLEALKELTGRDLNADEFRFEVKDAAGDVKAIGWNDIEGKVVFNALYFTQAGDYTYTVYEVAGDLGGVTYDEAIYTVTISVEDDGNGKLVAEVSEVKVGETVVADKVIKFTNEYAPKEITITLGAENTLDVLKNLEGRPMIAGEFKFVVLDKDGKEVATGTNDASGKIVFEPSITYTEVGEHTYTIAEVKGDENVGLTYDETIYTIVVTVTDDLKGQLVAEVTSVKNGNTTVDDKTAEFNNGYETGDTSIILEALKELAAQVRQLRDGEFTFIVTDMDGNEVARGQNDADGKITFSEIEYTFADAGQTYTYIISEEKGSLPGMTYDRNEYIVTVEVTDDGLGNLSAKATYPAGGIKFVNTYKPESTFIQLEANKALQVLAGSETLKEGQFEFYLAEQLAGGGYLVLSEKTNDAEGKVTFPIIEYTEAGTYAYVIGELAGDQGGVTYDNSEYIVTVEVTDDGDGKLAAAITGLKLVKGEEVTELKADAAVDFVNIYEAEPVTVEIQANKELTGKNLEEDEFEFVLEDSEGNKIYATNGQDGKISYTLQFGQVGTYNFTLGEAIPEEQLEYITYDGTVYTVTVEVTDDGNGKLHADVLYGSGEEQTSVPPVFQNTYTPNPIEVEIKGLTKVLNGRDMIEGEFTFELKDAEGNVVATGTNDAEGNIIFDKKLTFTEATEAAYTVAEVNGGDGHMIYDMNVYTINVTVTDDGKGTLTAEVTYGEDGTEAAPAFENTYTPEAATIVLEGTKTLTGRDLVAGEFQFVLEDAKGNKIYISHDENGKLLFPTFVYKAEGEHTYKVYEVAGDDVQVTYDDTVFEVTVVVKDVDGELKAEAKYPESGINFVNAFEVPGAPDSGDNAQTLLWIGLAVLSIGAIVVLLVIRKKYMK